jgi:NTP pyrophosphatase (non-canonical NTP hydrolase)
MKVLGYEIVDQQLNAVIDVVNSAEFTIKDLENAMRDNNVKRPPLTKYNEDLVFNRAATLIIRNLSVHGVISWDMHSEKWYNVSPVTYIMGENVPQFMTLNDYQEFTELTDVSSKEIHYYVLKLNGEAGEVADKLGKLMRGDYENVPPEEFRKQLALELGDVMWYIARLASVLDMTLEDVAQMNIEKLADRQARDVLKGSGDSR